MNVYLKVDLSSVKATRQQIDSQLSYATSLGLNETAKRVQTAIRAEIAKDFTIRRKAFINNSIKITRFARKTDLTATIAIQPPGDAQDVLSLHEDGGTKLPKRQFLAIPTREFQDPSRVLPDSKRPRALKNAFKTESRSGKSEVIVQVRGRGRNRSAVVAFILTPKGKIRSTRFFYPTAINTAESAWPDEFKKAFDKALASAK